MRRFMLIAAVLGTLAWFGNSAQAQFPVARGVARAAVTARYGPYSGYYGYAPTPASRWYYPGSSYGYYPRYSYGYAWGPTYDYYSAPAPYYTGYWSPGYVYVR